MSFKFTIFLFAVFLCIFFPFHITYEKGYWKQGIIGVLICGLVGGFFGGVAALLAVGVYIFVVTKLTAPGTITGEKNPKGYPHYDDRTWFDSHYP